VYILREAGLAQRTQRDVPSWCMDLSHPEGHIQSALPTKGDAGGTLKLEVELVPRYKDVITVRARKIGVLLFRELCPWIAADAFRS